MTVSLLRAGKTATARGAILGLTLLLAAPLSIGSADARAGGGSSAGSRGSSTFSAPPSTATAPRGATPMQRTETPSPSVARPGMGAPAAAQPGRFGGFGTGLMAGLLGAGLFGMLAGGGFFGGLGGLSSMLGLLFQVALIGGLIWLALRLFRGRGAMPALAGGPAMGSPAGGPAPYARSGLGNVGGGAGPALRSVVEITPADYASFDRSLVEIQNAYGREDLGALGSLATPEMVRYFGSDIEDNRRRGIRNAVSDAKLLQGDLAEAWREGQVEYATVVMRFSILDTMVDRTTGRVTSGDAARPVEATELWTFRREIQGTWRLSAIQQTA